VLLPVENGERVNKKSKEDFELGSLKKEYPVLIL